MQNGVYLASKARVLSMSVATLALQILLLDDLAGRLMLKLVVLKHCVQMRRYFWRFYLTEWLEAEAAGETPAPVVPHTPLTLDAVSLAQHTSTGMLSQALSAEIIPGQMKHPTNSSSSTCDRPMPHRNRIWLPPLPFQLHSCLHIASSPW